MRKSSIWVEKRGYEARAKSEKFITRFARYYTPAVVAVAALLALVPPLIVGGEWLVWLNRSLIFLVISCPCALVVSVPLTFFGGIGGASRKGILVKSSNYLEMMAHIKTVVFDKTGTLTEGKLQASRIDADKGWSEKLSANAANSISSCSDIIWEYTAVTEKLPSVRVPVLSNTTVFICAIISR